MLQPFRLFQLCRWNSIFYTATALFLLVFYEVSTRNTPTRQSSPSVNIILATVALNDVSWTKKLSIPNLKTIPYIADNQSAPHHPPINKGNEAMIYLAYCYDFYDNLPDISIFTHGQDYAWHIDGALNYSTANAINTLDLEEVLHRQYFNLRVSWDNACPAWINTSMRIEYPEFSAKLREEEPFVKGAFEWFLPNDILPPTFSAPCCSQFAATRSAIRSLPRKTYQDAMDWITKAQLPSSVTGRVFEHLWQYMFLHKPIDCPHEFKALCRMYHVCFEDEHDWEKWKTTEKSKWKLNDFRSTLLSNGYPSSNNKVRELGSDIDALDEITFPWRAKAVQRGQSRRTRMKLARGDI